MSSDPSDNVSSIHLNLADQKPYWTGPTFSKCWYAQTKLEPSQGSPDLRTDGPLGQDVSAAVLEDNEPGQGQGATEVSCRPGHSPPPSWLEGI